jgi:hypothetical protein
MKYIISFLFFSILLASCRPKNIDINVKAAESKLVVFTHVIPNNIMIVALTKSFSVLDGNTTEDFSKLLVSGATVQMKFNGETFNFYELNPGIYASFEKAFQVNENYELFACYGKDTIHSFTKMLPKIDFNKITPIVDKNTSDTTVYIDYSFNDIKGIDNWYLINIYKKIQNSNSADMVNYFKNGENSLIKSILISDKEFGDTYESKDKLDNLKYNDSIVVTLSNINETYFNYLNQKNGTGSVFTQLNIEPITYASNIINGYGFFNAHFPHINYFDIGKY